MGWEAHVRRHNPGKAKRKPWYTITLNGRDIPLGTDRARAYSRAAELLDVAGIPAAEPETVQGLVVAYERDTGRRPQGAVRFGEWAGPDKLLVSLKPADLQRFADWLVKTGRTRPRKGCKPKPLSAWSIRHYVADARAVWQWASASKGWAVCEPGKVRTPTPILQPRDMAPKLIKAALHKLNPRARAIATFIASTGCRPSEARHLRWDHISGATAVLAGKSTARTGRLRTLHLPPAIVALVEAQPRTNEYVFNTIRKTPWTKDGLHTVLDRAGIKSAYSLRHSFAQWFLDHGGPGGRAGDKAELQAWLGHADGRMTDVYAQVRDRRLQSVAKRIRGPLGA